MAKLKKRLFCFVDKNFKIKRLTNVNGTEIECEEYFLNLLQLDKLGTGGQADGDVIRYRDSNDTYYGGDIAMKRVRATTEKDQENESAYRELYAMQIVNRIPNGENYFV